MKARPGSKIILVIVILVAITPIIIMLFGSFKSNVALSGIPPDFSFKGMSFDNYEYIVKKGVFNSFLNSISIAVGTTALVLFLDSLAGYVFAIKKFPGKRLFFTLLLCTMMIPKQILMVPTFILLTKIDLYNTLAGVILSSAAVPFGVFLVKQFMQTLPDELFEAAKIDGCNEFQLYLKIAIPLSTPVLAALGIFVFVLTWNDFMWQLVMLTGRETLTLPLFVANLIAEKSSMPAYQFAGAVVATMPILTVFICSQRLFVSGITAGAVKG